MLVAAHDNWTNTFTAGFLTLHANRGAAMRSKPVASLLVDLEVVKSHSRPVNAKLKCPLFSKVEMSPFDLIFISKAVGKRQRVRPKAKGRGAVGN